MNLHGIARAAVSRVNPEISATLLKSTGYTTADDGARAPSYSQTTIKAQVQGVSGKDLVFLNNLGFQGVFRLVFVSGQFNGIIRADGKGGDILKFPDATGGTVRDWRAVQVKETWPDWSSVFVQMQSTAV